MASIGRAFAVFLVLYFLTECVLSIDVPKPGPRKSKGRNNNQAQPATSLTKLLVSECLTKALDLSYDVDKVKKALPGYVFKNKNILLRAVLHGNYKNKIRHKTNCVDRGASYRTLEYIGNFVLHYVLSRYILVDQKITDGTKAHAEKAKIETNLVSAYLAVKNGFNELLYIDATQEMLVINHTINELKGIKNIDELIKEKGNEQIKGILPSVFKSLVGAVYVDQECKTEEVEKIFTEKYKRALKGQFNN